jgi:transcriptional regulator with XRE-family HTH domain
MTRAQEILMACDQRPAEVARRLNIDSSTLSKLLNGKRGLGQKWAKRIGDYLGVPVSAFYEPIGAPVARSGAAMIAQAGPAATALHGCGDRLRLTRLAALLSIEQLAAASGLDARRLTEMENGAELPTIPEIAALRGALQVGADWLLFGDYSALSGRLVQRFVDLGIGAGAPLPARELRDALPDSPMGAPHTMHDEQSGLPYTIQQPDRAPSSAKQGQRRR